MMRLAGWLCLVPLACLFAGGCSPAEAETRGATSLRRLVLLQDAGVVLMQDADTGETVRLRLDRGSVIHAEIEPAVPESGPDGLERKRDGIRKVIARLRRGAVRAVPAGQERKRAGEQTDVCASLPRARSNGTRDAEGVR